MTAEGRATEGGFRHVLFAERSDIGRVRDNNEDVALCLPEVGLFAVADGMGGAREGEVAAKAVADHLREALPDPALRLPARIRRCREAVNEASRWIRQYAMRQGNPGMGTTLVVLLLDPANPSAAAVLHAGDSRLYRLRDGVLEQITTDHSVAALAGVASESHVPALFRSVITRAVGVRRHVELEVTSLEVRRGDLHLLCTDGVHGMMSREDMARILASDRDLDHKAVSLIEAALSGGGDDNATVVLVRTGAPEGVPGLGAAAIPEPVRDRKAEPHGRGPLVSLLMIALLGLAGLWFAFRSRQAPEKPLPAVETIAEPESPDVDSPETAPPAAEPPPPPAGEPSPPPSAPPPVPAIETAQTGTADAPPAGASHAVPPDLASEAWQAEGRDVGEDPEKLKARHAAAVQAFARLAAWTGKPLAAPSLMLAGHAEDRPEKWLRYLAEAQARWREAAVSETARMRAESACLSRPRLEALWRWVNGPEASLRDPEFRGLVAQWEEWTRELEQMERFLRDETGKDPFLYALRPDLFTPGRSAAELGDSTWGRVLSLVDAVWKRRGAWLDRVGEAGAEPVDEVIRQANVLWAGYVRTGLRVRPWRQAMQPEEADAFLGSLDRDVFKPGAAIAPEEEK